MKKIILTTICLIGLSFAQIESGGTPKFFNNRSLDMNYLSVDNAPMVDRDFDPMVFIYGHEYDMNINVLNSATSINDNGDVTYLLGISSDGAYGIGLNFGEFYLTDNATLYIYDEEQTYFLGSLTSKNNKEDATFSTSIVKGEKIILELTVPQSELNDIKLTIDSVIHDYTDILNYHGTHNDSSREDCNTNVICSDGDEWRDQINGVVRVSMGSGLCSASVVNNTANDRTPYVLFADHCVSGSAGSYVFYFNYQSTSCAGSSGSLNQSISGSTLLSQADINSGPDYALLRISSDIPDSYNPFYVGWSNVSTPPAEAIGIHHPGGDIKKISFTSDNVAAGGTGANFWEFRYDVGRVIPGSSGSPYFDGNKRQVGIASYIYTNYCDPSPDCYCSQQYDHGYGRFDRAWTLGLNTYLDPLNSGTQTLDGIGNSGINIVHDSFEDMPFENSTLTFNANVTAYSGSIDGVELHYDIGDGWNTESMALQNLGNYYTASIGGLYDGMIIDYYILGVSSDGIIQTYPNGAPDNSLLFILGDLPDLYTNDFEVSTDGWVIGDSSDSATAGIWELAIPEASFNDAGFQVQPGLDNTDDGNSCFVTGNGYELDATTNQNSASFDDVDGGNTTLFSPIFNLSPLDNAILTYYRWYTNDIGDNGNSDKWVVSVSDNGGNSWVDLENNSVSNASWVKQRFILSDYIDFNSEVQFKFVAEDILNTGDSGSGGSLVEAAVDDFTIEFLADGSGVFGDINFDESVDVLDVVLLVNMILGSESMNFGTADLNSDGSINVQDVILVINIILG
jgi:hypothetical protein